MIMFNNGKTLETATATRSRENVYGASRPIMEISVNSADTTEEEIRELFYDAEALSKITITDFSETGEEVAYEYANYKLPIYIYSYESNGEKTITMKIGQLTNTELQQEYQTAVLSALLGEER